MPYLAGRMNTQESLIGKNRTSCQSLPAILATFPIPLFNGFSRKNPSDCIIKSKLSTRSRINNCTSQNPKCHKPSNARNLPQSPRLPPSPYKLINNKHRNKQKPPIVLTLRIFKMKISNTKKGKKNKPKIDISNNNNLTGN
jgi:hypothetical protein